MVQSTQDVCPVMAPGKHCICWQTKDGGECCWCELGEPNCLDDENADMEEQDV